MKKFNPTSLVAIVFGGLVYTTVFAMPPPPGPVFPTKPNPPPPKNCETLKPIETPEQKLYCSQPGHLCVTNPLPYLKCLQEQNAAK